MAYRGDGPPAAMAYRGDAGQRRLRARANRVSVPVKVRVEQCQVEIHAAIEQAGLQSHFVVLRGLMGYGHLRSFLGVEGAHEIVCVALIGIAREALIFVIW